LLSGLAPHLGEADAVAGFHVFTFNDLAPTEAWRRRLLSDLT
jgi:methylenetetrahydrofolate reductase (NADPH)